MKLKTKQKSKKGDFRYCLVCQSGTVMDYNTHDGRPRWTCTRCGYRWTNGK